MAQVAGTSHAEAGSRAGAVGSVAGSGGNKRRLSLADGARGFQDSNGFSHG